jgi:hypothetical protein
MDHDSGGAQCLEVLLMTLNCARLAVLKVVCQSAEVVHIPEVCLGADQLQSGYAQPVDVQPVAVVAMTPFDLADRVIDVEAINKEPNEG